MISLDLAAKTAKLDFMPITHQTVLGADGEPVAALIPWDEFQVIKAELDPPGDAPLSDQWKAELNQRSRDLDNGAATPVGHTEMIDRVRENLRTTLAAKHAQ